MNIKFILILGITCLAIGFSLGRFTKKDSSKLTKNQTIQQKVVTQQQIVSQTDTHENVKSEKETITTQKVFSSKGKLKKETQTQIVYNQVNLSERVEARDESRQVIDTKLTKESLIIDPAKNWSLNSFIPVNNYKDYSDYSLQVSYRVYGQIWLSAQS